MPLVINSVNTLDTFVIKHILSITIKEMFVKIKYEEKLNDIIDYVYDRLEKLPDKYNIDKEKIKSYQDLWEKVQVLPYFTGPFIYTPYYDVCMLFHIKIPRHIRFAPVLDYQY